jgi:hypothetical protein
MRTERVVQFTDSHKLNPVSFDPLADSGQARTSGNGC